MAGRYNSLFGLDEELVKHPEQLKHINRQVSTVW